MSRAKRRELETRAYPDPYVLVHRRRRAGALLLSACALGVLHVYFPALLVAFLAMPNVVWYVRRELTLGALIAEAHRRRHRARLPVAAIDLREVYRRI